MIGQFKPALFFLLKFLGIYLIGNILYGIYIESFGLEADPVTRGVAKQCASILRVVGLNTDTLPDLLAPKVKLLLDQHSVVSIYEGCNGLNVMIIFLAFLVAYGSKNSWVKLAWFVMVGIVAIHLMNLGRIIGLFFVAEYFESYLYFTHKYLFTAVIYIGIFALWYWWIIISKNETHADKTA